MAIRALFVNLIATALLLKACAPSTCNPYAPDGGLFYNTVVFNPVPTTPQQVGSYSIALVNGQVRVIQGNATSPDALVTVPPGMLAFYLFYGANNRFLILDLHTDPSTSPPSIEYQPVVIDLTAWSPGTPPQPGHFLSSVFMPTTAQEHIFPSPGYTASSAGSGLAFFVWFGLGGGQISNAGIYRSDTGAQLCFTPSYIANVQAEAKVVPAAVQILDGGTVIQQCAIPSGSLRITPSTINFGSIPSGSSITQNVVLANTGNDCLTVSAISSSGPFSPKNFPASGIILSAGASQSVQISFSPNSSGTYSATLTVTSNPAVGGNSVIVSGIATAGQPQLTVKEILRPAGDPGLFNLLVDGAARAANVGNGGTTGLLTLSVGSHTVSETQGTGTSLSSYAISIDCGSGPIGGASIAVTLALGDKKTCTILDLGAPRLTVNKVLAPTSDPGLFNLLIDGAVQASNVGSGGSTGARVLSTGSHTVAESPAPGTNLANYTSVIGGDCSANGTVSLAAGDNKTCTITNTRPTPPSPPIFSPGPGTYLCPQKVSLSDPGATIFFTTDGSPPTPSSPQYSGPISVSATQTIQAIGVTSGGPSTVAAATYTCATYDGFEVDITVGTDDARTDSALEATLTTSSGPSIGWCLKYSDNGATSLCPRSHPGITWQPGQTYSNTFSWNSGASSFAGFSTLKVALTQFPGFGKSDDNWDIQEIDVYASSSSVPNKHVLILSRVGSYPVQSKSCYARLKHPHGLNPTSVVFIFNPSDPTKPGAPEFVQDDDGPHSLPYCQE